MHRLKTGQSSFEWQVILCDDRDALARSTIFGVVIPVVLFQLATKVDTVKQEEAARVINLMRATSDRIRREEQQKLGVVITDARYGQAQSFGSPSYILAGDRTIDVTIPLQAMVNDSQLRIYSVKSQLPGFYDPCPGEPKMLQVRYMFRDEPHAVTVADDMPLQIPTKSHRISGQHSL
ncbi:hypothetical protein ANCCEY_09595 [Ancylostoma ceylanicum]|uniref:DnaJ-like protein C11 C-terminal domain-containing protein n=1 Tax=Ancylostoma ceylanicum TaxID=53326 RepID=A0A0D6LUK4_9BILA|nr:hypothetical protein ANCCEY_09595 [Ancylostoma ceylanicum]